MNKVRSGIAFFRITFDALHDILKLPLESKIWQVIDRDGRYLDIYVSDPSFPLMELPGRIPRCEPIYKRKDRFPVDFELIEETIMTNWNIIDEEQVI